MLNFQYLNSQSQQWPQCVCVGLSAVDQSAGSKQPPTSLDGVAAAYGGSRHTSHQRPDYRKEAKVKGDLQLLRNTNNKSLIKNREPRTSLLCP